jgi:hypothetical protein
MIDPKTLEQLGRWPLLNKPARFAVGDPAGVTSNAWRVWAQKQDLYIACRDNFRETKVSLHASGRWRMGFTSEAVANQPHLIAPDQNRAWDVWDAPKGNLRSPICAFHLVFATSELAVSPEQRGISDWKNVVFVEAAPAGKVTVATLFVSDTKAPVQHETEPSFVLAEWSLGENRWCQLVLHGEPEGALPQLIANSVGAAKAKAIVNGTDIPPGAYAYFLGQRENGVRFLFGAKAG